MNPQLSTLAERSDYRQTGRIDEVDHLCAEFERTWPAMVRSIEYGRSAENRSMRALLVSPSGTLTAAALRAHSVPLLMLQGGIHPGESDGKDAGFIALRELLEAPAASAALDGIAILFVPAFNTDGHERCGRWNRPNQQGPVETGWRTTAQNINLNRDYTKADAPEMRAMLHLIAEWDPLVCADLHVTDGADFQPDVSLQAEPLNQGDPSLRPCGRELRDGLMAKLVRQGSMPIDFYPDLAKTDDPSSGFALTVYSPRFSTGYFPQRNRFTVLVETHSWKKYARRVHVMRNTIVGLTELMVADGARWLAAARSADRAALALAGSEIVLDYGATWREPAKAGASTVARQDAGARMVNFPGYAYTRTPSAISGGLVTVYDPGTPQVWRVPFRDQVAAAVSTTVPGGCYAIPAGFAADLQPRLEAHGIAFERLTQARASTTAEVFRADRVDFSALPFEGRMRAAFVGAWENHAVSLQPGTLLVPVAQPLVRLLVALFEPMAPDSFAAWGFFNSCFEQKEHMEPYVAEAIARTLLAADPSLADEFARRLDDDAEFASSPSARLEFFLRRHESWDVRFNLYPILRLGAMPT